MFPQFAPTNLFSAFWPIKAISVCVKGKSLSCWQNLPVATSRAAEELKPEECGTFPEITKSAPCLNCGQRS